MISVHVLPISLALAALLGFAAHRSSLCTVKAVEEILTTRRALMLWSFAKTSLWTMAVTALLLWLLPETRAHFAGWNASLHGLAGGVIFGMGAVINGGCAFSTLTRLGDGRLAMLLTLAGFGLGAAVHNMLLAQLQVPAASPGDALLAQAALWPLVLCAALLSWGAWEVWRLWRTRPVGLGPLALILAERYRLSTAALLMGLSNALLYAFHGNWAYTSTIDRGVRQVLGAEVSPDPMPWLLFLALVAGMVCSAWQRRRFRLQWRPELSWIAYLLGGTFMGFGSALVPGGNDVLLLHGIPSLSPHALPAYVAMLFGITATLGLLRLAGIGIETIDCSGDICAR